MRAIGVVAIDTCLHRFAGKAKGNEDHPRPLFGRSVGQFDAGDSDAQITQRVHLKNELVMVGKGGVLELFRRAHDGWNRK